MLNIIWFYNTKRQLQNLSEWIGYFDKFWLASFLLLILEDILFLLAVSDLYLRSATSILKNESEHREMIAIPMHEGESH